MYANLTPKFNLRHNSQMGYSTKGELVKDRRRGGGVLGVLLTSSY